MPLASLLVITMCCQKNKARWCFQVAAQEAAGLDDKYYNTNAAESINALVKKDESGKRFPLQFVSDLLKLVQEQAAKFEFVIIGNGNFR